MQKLGRYIVIRSGQAENTYGMFCREILKSEGLRFEVVDLDTPSLPQPAPGDLIIITRCFLSTEQIDRLLTGIENGASAIVLQPQHLLKERLGLTREPGIILPGYVKLAGKTFGPDVLLQTHLPIPITSPPDTGQWETLAEALSPDRKNTGHPAVISSQLGKGKVALFFYDLAEAVARIRFGNPDLASYHTLQWAWPHLGDMYLDHIDEDLAHIPQADIHAQFLADVATDLCGTPLGRLWYYERTEYRTACVFESDGDMSKTEEFERLASAVEKRGGHATFYLMKGTKLSEQQVQAFRDRGHTFGPHVNPLARGEEVCFAIPKALAEETEAFKARFGQCSPTLQCHCAPWAGYMELVPVHIEHGYRLLFAPLSLPMNLWSKYMCGSGRAMKFYDRSGVLHDCWHQPVLACDDTTLIERLGSGPDAAFREFEDTLKSSLDHTHTTIPIMSHPVSFSQYSAPMFEQCFDLLQKEGVPIYSGDEWCSFLDRRSAVQVEQEQDEDGTMRFLVSNLVGQIPLMIPLGDSTSTVLVDGNSVEGTTCERLGRRWLCVEIEGRTGRETIQIDVNRSANNG